MPCETLVTDHVIATLEVSEEEAVAIHDALQRICGDDDRQYGVFGRNLRVLRSKPGLPAQTRFSPSPPDGCDAKIYLASPEEPEKQIYLRFRLLTSYPDRLHLEAEFAPTTILSGNNVLPTTIRSESDDGGLRWSSSAPRYLGPMLRVGFDLLEAMHGQRTKGQRLFGASRARIREGDFRLRRVQWATYLPTPDRKRFLQLLSVMYGQTIARGNGVIGLARHLGLECQYYHCKGSDELSGLVLQSFWGNAAVSSVSFYDKRYWVAHKRQWGTLTAEERAIVEDNIRVDMTLQPEGIVSICSAAKRHALANPEIAKLCDARFLRDEPVATAWWLERGVTALSLFVADARVLRGSFARWLVPYMIERVAQLPPLVACRCKDLVALLRLDHPLVRAWRDAEASQGGSAIDYLCRVSGLSRSSVYKARAEWLARFHVDLLVPFAFYRDLFFFGPNSLSSESERSAALEAGDGGRLLALRRRGAERFERAKAEFVGPALAGGALEMPARLIGDPLSTPIRGGGEEGVRRAPDQSRLFRPSRVARRAPAI
jgi:hypothetical protein